MESIYAIGMGMVAITLAWVGYFLGVYFPVFGPNREKAQQYQPVEKALDKLTDLVKWILEDDDKEEGEDETAIETDQSLDASQKNTSTPFPPYSPSQQTPLSSVNQPDFPFSSRLWYNKKTSKLVAEVGGEMVDLNTDLSSVQHGELSLLLVDLQDHVGISAAMQAVLGEKVDETMEEKKMDALLGKADSSSSINPVKTFVNYIQSDVPTLADHQASIPEKINHILQEQIKGTALDAKAIRVSDWQKGVAFLVEGNIFHEIHDIPDSTIRNAIRNAVKTFEEQDEG